MLSKKKVKKKLHVRKTRDDFEKSTRIRKSTR